MFWLIMAVLLWGFLHSFLASLQVKAFAQRVFGTAERRFYRLAYNIFAVVSFAPVLVITALTPDRMLYAIPFPWVILPLAGQVLALIALAAAFRQTDAMEFLGLLQLFGKAAGRPVQLNTTGLYRWVRHPLYTAGLVFIWLMPYMTLNVLVINIGLTVYVIIGAYFEERKLRRKFGETYARYQASTSMLIPFTRRNKHPSLSS